MKWILTLLALIVFTISNGQNLETCTLSFWDDNDWSASAYLNFQYDSYDNITHEDAYSWIPDINAFQISAQLTYEYNAQNQVSNTLRSIYDEIDDEWTDLELSTYSYNANNLIESIIEQSMLNGSWLNEVTTVYEYDLNDRVITETRKNWIESEMEWEDNIQTNYSYSSDDSMITEIDQLWEPNNEVWINLAKRTKAVDAMGKTTSILSEGWLDEVWVMNSLESFSYDSDEYLMTILIESYFDIIGWTPSILINVNHNENGAETERLIQQWNSDNETWVNDVKLAYSYYLETGIEESEIVNSKIYPNPAVNELNIELKKNNVSHVAIINSIGRVVDLQSINNIVSKIYIDHLSPGVYLLQIHNDNGVSVHQFVKE